MCSCIKRVLIPEGRVASNLRELNLLDTLRSLFSSSPQVSQPYCSVVVVVRAFGVCVV